MNSRNFLILSGCLILSLIIASIARKAIQIRDADVTFAFVSDLVEFTKSNKCRMPSDWQQFNEWYQTKHTGCRWPAAELAEKFDVRWCADLASATNGLPLLNIRDPQLQYMESALNELIRRRAIGIFANPNHE